MDNAVVGDAQPAYGRIAGFMYLLVLATAVFAEFYVRSSLLVPGDAAATAANIIAREQLFRLGVAAELISFSGIVVLALALYVLLAPVDKALAGLAMLWWTAEAVMLGVTAQDSLVVLQILGNAHRLAAFDTDQVQALATLSHWTRASGYDVALIFFSLGSTVFSALLFGSGYIPRILAGLGVAASIVVLLGLLALVVDPRRAAFIAPWFFAPIFLYELLAGLWLLLIGANVGRVARTNQTSPPRM